MAFRGTADPILVADNNEDAAYGRTRRRIFLYSAAATILVGLTFTLLQSAVYQSQATVLMSAPTAIDQQMLDADVQGVAIQRRTLTGRAVGRALADTLRDSYGYRLDDSTLRELLQVEGIPDTNLLALRTVGTDAKLLPLLLESWIEVYSDLRSGAIRQQRDQTLTEVQRELDELDGKLYEARQSLEDYRDEHQIISMGREQNSVLAKLDGLNNSLNNAIEEEVNAKAYLDTLRTSLASGDKIVPQNERSDVSAMAQLLTELRSRLSELRARYTDDYIDKDPRLREIPQQVSTLEIELAEALDAGSQIELANAERAYLTARTAVTNLEQRLGDHKASVAQFNTIYATHEALVQDLASLEQLNRETQARLVQIEVRQIEIYPQVTVIDWPAPQAQRIGPPYLLLLAGTAVCALLSAIFAVWLYGFLHPRRTQPTFVALSGVHTYAQGNAPALESDRGEPKSIAEDREARLEFDDATSQAKDSEDSEDPEDTNDTPG